MKRFIKLVLLGLLVCMTTSCISNIEDKIEFKGVKNVEIKGTSAISLDVVVDNQSSRKIGIEQGVIILRRGNKVVATLTQQEKMTIAKRCESTTTTLWRMKIDALTLLSIGKLLFSEQGRSELSVDLEAKVSSGVWSRNIFEQNVPLSEFMSNFGN